MRGKSGAAVARVSFVSGASGKEPASFKKSAGQLPRAADRMRPATQRLYGSPARSAAWRMACSVSASKYIMTCGKGWFFVNIYIFIYMVRNVKGSETLA